jgi:hypothetical protein
MSANIKASVDGTQAIIGVGGVDQMTVSNAGVVTANSFVGAMNSSSVTATGSTTARTLANRFADVVNVKDFGAVGNGVADDTAAIQNAFNYAQSTGYSLVKIPSGRYSITSNITINNSFNILIRGEGKGVTNLIFNNNSGIIVNAASFSQLNTFGICSLTLSANQQGGTAISVSNSTAIESETLFEDLEISSFSGIHQTSPLTYWEKGIETSNLRFCTFNNISIWGGEAGSGVDRVYPTDKAISMSGNTVNFNFIFNNLKITSCTYGLYIYGFLEGVYATNAEIWNCDYPLYVDGSIVAPSKISTLRFSNYHLNAAKVAATFINVTDVALQNCNIVRSIPRNGDFNTIYLEDTTRFILHGNTIWSGNGSTNLIKIKDSLDLIICSNIFNSFATIINTINLQNIDKYSIYGNYFNGSSYVGDIGILIDSSCSDGAVGINYYTDLTKNIEDNASNKSNPSFSNEAVIIASETGSSSISLFGNVPQIKFNPNNATAQNCVIDFRSSGLSDYDSRIITPIGSGASVAGSGNLFINTGNLFLNGQFVNISSNTFRPSQDNVYNLGDSIFRWANIFAQTSTIGTSDLREKQEILQLSDSEKNVAIKLKKIICKFKFNKAVQKKGTEKARWHFGIIAQEVKEIFESENLNAEEYGLFCYDEFEEQKEIKNDNGDILQKYQEAGNIYGIRYEELTMFILANL